MCVRVCIRKLVLPSFFSTLVSFFLWRERETIIAGGQEEDTDREIESKIKIRGRVRDRKERVRKKDKGKSET